MFSLALSLAISTTLKLTPSLDRSPRALFLCRFLCVLPRSPAGFISTTLKLALSRALFLCCFLCVPSTDRHTFCDPLTPSHGTLHTCPACCLCSTCHNQSPVHSSHLFFSLSLSHSLARAHAFPISHPSCLSRTLARTRFLFATLLVSLALLSHTNAPCARFFTQSHLNGHCTLTAVFPSHTGSWVWTLCRRLRTLPRCVHCQAVYADGRAASAC